MSTRRKCKDKHVHEPHRWTGQAPMRHGFGGTAIVEVFKWCPGVQPKESGDGQAGQVQGPQGP